MSLQDISIDLDDLSFEIPRRAPNNNFDGSIYKEVVPPAITIQRAVKNRNRRCMPSDDEESDEEDDEDNQSILSTEENELSPAPRVQSGVRSSTTPVPVAVTVPAKKPTRKSQPLPSDDEDSEDDEDNDDDDEERNQNNNNVSRKHNQKSIMQHSAYQPVQSNTVEDIEEEEDDDDNEALLANRDPNAGPILTLVEGSHLQQLHQMQQYHQAKLALFQNQIQPSKSNPLNARRQQHGGGGGGGGPRTMSGMDLLVQLEQEKADAKRIKPKVVHKLEGLLGRLPEPGSHNISFQQVQQQQQQQQQRTMQSQQHYYQQQQQRGYLDPNIQHQLQLQQFHQQQQQQQQLQQLQQQAYHYSTSRSPSPIHHRSLSPNPHIRSPSPNARNQPNTINIANNRNNRIHNQL